LERLNHIRRGVEFAGANRFETINNESYIMIIDLLHKLAGQLKTLPDNHEAIQANNLADVMAGKKNIIESPEALFSYLESEPKLKIHIDSPKGSKKGFGDKKRVLPFDYGELSGVINVADNMGWDIIFPPSQPTNVKKLTQIGIVKVKNDKQLWKDKAGRLPPVGNDKVIVSGDGTISDKDRSEIESFFAGMWQFDPIKWFI